MRLNHFFGVKHDFAKSFRFLIKELAFHNDERPMTHVIRPSET